MPDITSEIKVYPEPFFGTSGSGCIRTVYVTTPATADTGDTFTLILSNYGSGPFLGIKAVSHSTTNSIVISHTPTTSVTSGVLTITLGSVSNKKVFCKIYIGDGL